VPLDSQIEELQNALGELSHTKESPGWKRIVDAVNALIRAGRMESFNNDISSLEDSFKECKLKARIAGMQQVLLTLDTLIDEADTDLKALLEEREEENA